MEAVENASWTQARAKLVRRERKPRVANIFAGSAIWEKATIAGLPVLRLSVSPTKSEPVPASFAIVDEKKGWATEAVPAQLPLNITWQQSMPGRFDFYFSLPKDARCLGLGERFSSMNLRGNIHTLVNTDNPHHNEGMDSMYKSIPFLIVQQGPKCLGVFIDSPAPQRWDLDSDLSEKASVELFTRRGWQMYIIGEGTLPQMVAAFTELVGRAELPPLWSLGHQQCRWSYPDEDTIRYIAHEYRTRKIPCDTIVLDIDYMDEYRVFTYSKERFPHFPKLAQEMAAQSFKLITIVDPGVKLDPRYPLYQEAIDKKLICYKPDGTPFTDKVWPGVCVFPDFLKPLTREWWARHHEFYTDAGIAGIWNDMNEPAFFEGKAPLPPNMVQAPTPEEDRFTQEAPEGRVAHLEVRNLYGMTMCRATHDALVAMRPSERPFVLTRSGYAGLQRYAAVWLGDNMSWFEHLRRSIPMLLNIGLSGVAFAGCDIGGFGGNSDAELLVRWYELGIFYPFCRNHCALEGFAQEPWAFGPEAESKIRELINWRYQLLPYIRSLFWEHKLTGAPLMRPLNWHYPNDPIAADIDDQFMFGSDLLVAPVTDRGHTRRDVYFPAGKWHPLQGGEAIEGGGVHSIPMPPGTVPAFVREGAIIPLADRQQSTAEYDNTTIRFCVYGATANGTIWLDDGHSTDYRSDKYSQWHLSFQNGKLNISKHLDAYKPTNKFVLSDNGKVTPLNL